MKRRLTFWQTVLWFFVLPTLGVALAGVGAALYKDGATNKALPKDLGGTPAARQVLRMGASDLTQATWDSLADQVHYAGSGPLDPSLYPGVVADQLSLYFQSYHCSDGGCGTNLWWKSGPGNTDWVEFGAGGGGGGATVSLDSPLGTIDVTTGGGAMVHIDVHHLAGSSPGFLLTGTTGTATQTITVA